MQLVHRLDFLILCPGQFADVVDLLRLLQTNNAYHLCRQSMNPRDSSWGIFQELFYQPLHHLSGAWEQIQEALASADRVADLLDEAPEITDSLNAVALLPAPALCG